MPYVGLKAHRYCLLGLPFDALTQAEAIARIEAAVASRQQCVVSTPNLNFCIAAREDAPFRESVIDSELSVVDGMYLVWVAKLLRVPIPERVAGSDLFARLRRSAGTPLKVFFFGGPPGVAAVAAERLAEEQGRLHCVGVIEPGFASIESMSEPHFLDQINASGADLLILALGAKKGQAWIQRNRAALTVPVISHLGAVVNFVAGTVRRAPLWVQRLGLEWVWRIKEEPSLWRRYWHDGLVFLGLLLTRVLPYALYLRGGAAKRAAASRDFSWSLDERPGQSLRIALRGSFCAVNVGRLDEIRWPALGPEVEFKVSLDELTYIDSAGIGWLLDLRRKLDAEGVALQVCGAPPAVTRIFHWNDAAYLSL